MLKVVIDRATWKRGGKPDTCLLDSQGMRCCLGFVCNALGFSDQEILSVSTPITLYGELEKMDEHGKHTEAFTRLLTRSCTCEVCKVRSFTTHKPAIADMISANDANKLSAAEREAKLIELAKEVDIELVFEG